MACYFLINSNKVIVGEFDAADNEAARTTANAWVVQNRQKVILAGAMRCLTPTTPKPSTVIDDQPA